jgi:polyferredoxin
MKGGAIFLAFFLFFTLATLAVPIPLFPGNVVRAVLNSLGIPVSFYTLLLGAVANGLLYGFVVWIVFVLVSRKLEEPEVVIDPRERKRHGKKRSISH